MRLRDRMVEFGAGVALAGGLLFLAALGWLVMSPAFEPRRVKPPATTGAERRTIYYIPPEE